MPEFLGFQSNAALLRMNPYLSASLCSSDQVTFVFMVFVLLRQMVTMSSLVSLLSYVRERKASAEVEACVRGPEASSALEGGR